MYVNICVMVGPIYTYMHKDQKGHMDKYSVHVLMAYRTCNALGLRKTKYGHYIYALRLVAEMVSDQV